MKVNPTIGLRDKYGGELGPKVRCPQCGMWTGFKWNVAYHKMDCSAYDVVRVGSKWREVIRNE